MQMGACDICNISNATHTATKKTLKLGVACRIDRPFCKLNFFTFSWKVQKEEEEEEEEEQEKNKTKNYDCKYCV